jgi:hypothetical protein
MSSFVSAKTYLWGNWRNMIKTDENRRSHTLLLRKSEPTNEREQNQACMYYAERGGGRLSQMFVKTEGRIM